jgi:hypothetical protein
MILLSSIPNFIPFTGKHISLAEWMVQEHLPRSLYPKENPGEPDVQLSKLSTQVGWKHSPCPPENAPETFFPTTRGFYFQIANSNFCDHIMTLLCSIPDFIPLTKKTYITG